MNPGILPRRRSLPKPSAFVVLYALFSSGITLLGADAPPPRDLRALKPPASATARGEWPTYRGDAAQTGRALLPGKIKSPAVSWKLFVGRRQALLALREGAGDHAVDLPAPAALNPKFLSQQEKDWAAGAEFVDLAGDGKLVRVTPNRSVKYAKFLPDAKGVQKFVMEDGMSVKLRPDGPRKPVAIGTLYRYDRGKEEVVWRTEPQEQCEIPLCAVADMDGDGKPDIAVSTWWRVIVFDGETGKKKDECRWHKGRNYGHFQTADLNGDGLPEAIVMADFMIHLDLLRNAGGKLQVQWTKPVEFTLFGKRKSLRALPDAVVRAKGRAPMLVTNLFNDAGDEKWHVMLWDAMSGAVAADLADRYCFGHADLDGSGSRRLMLARTVGPNTPPVSDLYLGSFSDGKWQETALPVKGSWLTHTPPMPPDRATCAADGQRTAAVTQNAGGRIFWVCAPQRLLGLRLDGGKAQIHCELALPEGLSPEVLCLSRDGSRLLLALQGAEWKAQRIAGRGLEGELVSIQTAPQLPDVPVVARLENGGPPLIVAPYGNGEIAAVQAEAGQPRILWHRPGRSRSDAAEQHYYGVETASLLGDGARQVIAGAKGPDGEAVLLGYDAQGRERFRHAFARFSGEPPAWNCGGLTQWLAAPLAGNGRTQLYASLRRSVMHTDESFAVEVGGKELWRQTVLIERGCGGKPVAVAEFPDGGCAIVGQYPDIHFVLDGRTGNPLVATRFPDKALGGWTAYSCPVLFDFNGDGALEALTSACNYTLAVLTLDGQALWNTPYLDGATSQVGVRVNAGRVEIGVAAYRGGFRCHAGKDGALLWSFKTPRRVTTDVVTCDIDGDGEEEFLFGSAKTLYALGAKENTPAVKWQLDFPQNVFAPVCADVDGDGASEVLALCADGYLYCVGPAPGK